MVLIADVWRYVGFALWVCFLTGFSFVREWVVCTGFCVPVVTDLEESSKESAVLLTNVGVILTRTDRTG